MSMHRTALEEAEVKDCIDTFACWNSAQTINITQAELETRLAQLEQLLDGNVETIGHFGHCSLMGLCYTTHAMLYAKQKQPLQQYSECTPETVAEANAHAKAKLKVYKERILDSYNASVAAAARGAAAPP